MSNGRPGVSQQMGGTGFAANEAEIYQMGDLQGQFNGPMLGADGLVYMGDDYKSPDVTRQFSTPDHLSGSSGASETVIPSPEPYFTIEQAQMEFYRLDDQQRERFTNAVAGYLQYDPSPERVQAEWNKGTLYSAGYQKATGEKLSPFEYYEGLAGRASGAQGRGGGAYTGPVTTESRSKRVNLSNPSEARAFLDNALGEYLGRLPDDEEYENFRKALNAQQRMSPQIAESTQTVTPQGQARREVESDEKTSGGLEPRQFAREYARSQEGAAETGAAGPLLNAFLGLLRGGE